MSKRESSWKIIKSTKMVDMSKITSLWSTLSTNGLFWKRQISSRFHKFPWLPMETRIWRSRSRWPSHNCPQLNPLIGTWKICLHSSFKITKLIFFSWKVWSSWNCNLTGKNQNSKINIFFVKILWSFRKI